jgi:hypothetical protein
MRVADPVACSSVPRDDRRATGGADPPSGYFVAVTESVEEFTRRAAGWLAENGDSLATVGDDSAVGSGESSVSVFHAVSSDGAPAAQFAAAVRDRLEDWGPTL